MATLRLNKQLYTDINRLKLLNKSDEHGRFILEESPFDDDNINEDGPSTATGGNRCITVTGRIFPNTKIYNQGSYRIRLSLTPNYPSEPPTVKFITRIYHPNVATDGIFCYELLDLLGGWTRTKSLVDVIRIIIQYLDQPDLDLFENRGAADQYLHARSTFDQNAMEYVKQYALPRYVR